MATRNSSSTRTARPTNTGSRGSSQSAKRPTNSRPASQHRVPQRAAQHQTGRQQGSGGYQQMELTGALFHNDKPNGPDSPYYLGSVTVEGVKYWVSGWINTAQSGKRYVGLKLRPVDEAAPAPTDEQGGDDIPF